MYSGLNTFYIESNQKKVFANYKPKYWTKGGKKKTIAHSSKQIHPFNFFYHTLSSLFNFKGWYI
jgi:hypothetical protein